MLERLISLPPISFCLEVWDTYARAGISRSAAALAYYLVLTLFPLVMCVNYLIGLFHFDLEQVLQAADALLPVGVTARYSKEFAAFLKETYGHIPGDLPYA